MNVIDATLQNPLIGILDEDASIRTFTRRLAMALGFRTEAFCSACEFLTSNRVTDFACLILDRRMRGIGVRELPRRLSVQDRAPRVISMGAHEGEDENPVTSESGPRGVFAQTGLRTGVVHRDHQSAAAAFEVRIAHAILAIRL